MEGAQWLFILITKQYLLIEEGIDIVRKIRKPKLHKLMWFWYP